jgi:hypothetical protein
VGGSYGVSSSTTGIRQNLGTVYVMERITPQWNLRQTYVHTSYSSFMTYGGEYFSNRFSAGVYYNTTYIPTNLSRPYQPNYSFNGTLRLTNRISLNGSKSIDPYGKGYYIASATLSSYSTGWAGNHAAIHIGEYVVRGQVMTTDNKPVEGIAILIDKALVSTDIDGYFELREHNRKSHRLTVDLRQSATQMNYEVISAPSRIESSAEGGPVITIVVKPTAGRGGAQVFIEHEQIKGQARNARPAAPASAPTATNTSKGGSTPTATNAPKGASTPTATNVPKGASTPTASAAPTNGSAPAASVTYTPSETTAPAAGGQE